MFYFNYSTTITNERYFFKIGIIKKTWNSTAVVPHSEALALPVSLEQQREAHAEYKITLVLFQ